MISVDEFIREHLSALQHDIVRIYQFREAWRDGLKRFKIGTPAEDVSGFLTEQHGVGEHLMAQVAPAVAPLELGSGEQLAHATFSDAASIADDDVISAFKRGQG